MKILLTAILSILSAFIIGSVGWLYLEVIEQGKTVAVIDSKVDSLPVALQALSERIDGKRDKKK